MLGAYFQCYKEPTATFESLKAFRTCYPTSTIVLLSDNGYDYTEMAKYFNCIYIQESCNLPFSIRNEHERFYLFIVRMEKVLRFLSEPYILWLEDDVNVIEPYSEPFIGSLNGNCINTLRSSLFDRIPFSLFKGEAKFTGHGGSVYDKQFFIYALSKKDEICWLVENWLSLELGTTIDQDVFFSVLFLALGGTIHPLSQHKEYYTNGIYNSGFAGVSVIHQWNINYGIPLLNELKYLVSTEKIDT